MTTEPSSHRPRVIYYVAASLDGFIASEDGGVDWLSTVDVDGEDYGYDAFYASIDALLMGRSTFDQIVDFGEWPYAGKPTWVCTSDPSGEAPDEVTLSSRSPVGLVGEIGQSGHETVWLVGGGAMAGALLEAHMIDTVLISVIPTVLGRGIPLFRSSATLVDAELVSSNPYPSGLIQNAYRLVPSES